MVKIGESDLSPLSINKKIHDILNRELRELIACPRNIPRRQREDIAEILLRDVLDGGYDIKDPHKFVKKYGAFYPIFISLKSSSQWQKIKEIANKSEIGAILLIQYVLVKVFDFLESTNDEKNNPKSDLDEDLKSLLEKFRDLIEETLSLWSRRLNTDEIEEDEACYELLESIDDFMEQEQALEFLDDTMEKKVLGSLDKEIEKIQNSLETLETLSLLMPGRLWDKSLNNLHRIYLQNINKYAAIFRNNEDLQKIVDMIGRISLEYGTKQIEISPLGKSEIHSVTQSNDIYHLLPFELAKFNNPIMKRKFYADLIEGKLLTYELQGKNWSDGPPKKRKGPVVALIDTSGSMHGTPELMAKAIILAIAKKMLKEERDVRVILFASTDQTHTIDLTSKNRMAEEFLDFLGLSFSGGNDSNTPLIEGMKSLEEDRFKGADLLFITDGIWPSPDKEVIERWNMLKKEKDARIFTLVIGNNNAGGLTPVSDYTYLMDRNIKWDCYNSPVKLIKYINTS